MSPISHIKNNLQNGFQTFDKSTLGIQISNVRKGNDLPPVYQNICFSFQLAQYHAKDSNNLFMVRIAQGLVHMGKGTMTLNPFHSDNQVTFELIK